MRTSQFKQRGAAALVVAMVLLFAMTAVAFFANRGMIFEQRTSANQVRYTKAFELADAGIEWAIARLNDPLTLTTAATCDPLSGAGLFSFRERYLRPTAADANHATGWFNPVSAVYPGCQIDPASGAWSCGCPAAGAATLAAATQPRFRVQFIPVTVANNPSQDFQAVEIVSRGCTNGDPCDPSQPATGSDSTTVVRTLVKLRATFPTVPGAGMISGSTTLIGGSVNVINTDTATNGITINTGSTVEINARGFTVQSLPGTAPAQSILDNDPSLLRLTNADANGERFFSSFLGQGFSDYQNDLGTRVLTPVASGGSYAAGTCDIGNGPNAGADCARAVSYWVDRGVTKFWVDGAVAFGSNTMPTNTSTLGTATRPVAVVARGDMSFGSGVTAYGIFYSASATVDTDATLGNGNPTIIGSFISRGDISKRGGGDLTVAYNGNLFGVRGAPTGILVPVPGSWRDKATSF